MAFGGTASLPRTPRAPIGSAGTYAIAATDSLVIVRATATGTVNLTLPSGPTGPIPLENRKNDVSDAARVLHITPGAGQTIEGQATAEHDTGFATFTLLGSDWLITG